MGRKLAVSQKAKHAYTLLSSNFSPRDLPHVIKNICPQNSCKNAVIKLFIIRYWKQLKLTPEKNGMDEKKCDIFIKCSELKEMNHRLTQHRRILKTLTKESR